MSGIGGGPLEELQHSIDVNTKSDDCSDDSDLELSTGEDDHNSVSQSFDLHTPFDAVSSYATVDVPHTLLLMLKMMKKKNTLKLMTQPKLWDSNATYHRLS